MQTVSLVGYRFNNLEQEEVVNMIESSEYSISFEREPLNVYDKEAVALYSQQNSQERVKLGYIAKNHTKFIKEYIDKQLQFEINELFPQSISINVSPIEPTQ